MQHKWEHVSGFGKYREYTCQYCGEHASGRNANQCPNRPNRTNKESKYAAKL